MTEVQILSLRSSRTVRLARPKTLACHAGNMSSNLIRCSNFYAPVAQSDESATFRPSRLQVRVLSGVFLSQTSGSDVAWQHASLPNSLREFKPLLPLQTLPLRASPRRIRRRPAKPIIVSSILTARFRNFSGEFYNLLTYAI